jgi:hypothetical protein
MTRLAMSRRWSRVLGLTLFLAMMLPGASAAGSQGCSSCRDNVAGSAPKVQRGLRRGIPLLAIPAVGMLAAFLWVGAQGRGGDIDEAPSGNRKSG